jgi:dienelactone hydrolase
MSSEDTNIAAETVTYETGGTILKGYLAFQKDASSPRPGVLVLPEWWGVNDYIRERTRRVAELGYTALAVDMYGEGKTANDPTDAGNLMNGVLEDFETGTARLEAGYEYLRNRSESDAERIAAIGYCFGGAVALHGARIGMDLKGVVSFHGALGSFHTPEPGSVKARILVCHGGDDQFVSAAEVTAFKEEMDQAKADYQFVVYNGALHGFTSPAADENGKKYGIPLAYNAAADKASWQEMQELLSQVLS